MKIKEIEKILISHGVPYYIEEDCTFANSMMSGTEIFEVVEDLTTITKKKIYIWLGY